MRKAIWLFLLWIGASGAVQGATKSHVIAFGKWLSVNWFTDAGDKSMSLKIRPLYVDGQLKEYTLGQPHEITERLFVVQRAFRMNDNLPGEAVAARWLWEPGGWLVVDRGSGRISAATLPEFDPLLSSASWYRDCVAYCGASDDGKRLDLMVVQLGRRKPLLRKNFRDSESNDTRDPACPAPTWFRHPVRVEFDTGAGQRISFSPRQRVLDFLDRETEEGSSE
ncbi:MAG TPA: hypothetical protein VGF08_12620 [Terriglobales bacterium]|jgi:hypothetical protein